MLAAADATALAQHVAGPEASSGEAHSWGHRRGVQWGKHCVPKGSSGDGGWMPVRRGLHHEGAQYGDPQR